MAITPKEASGLTQDQLAVVEQLEKYIDNQLRQRFAGGSGQVSIALSRASRGPLKGIDLSTSVVAELKRRYEEAGWEAKCSSDQRDGVYITLAPKRVCT